MKQRFKKETYLNTPRFLWNMKQLLEKLFDEKTVKILNEIQDKNQVQVRDISRRTGISPATVFRILKMIAKKSQLEKKKRY